MASEAWTHEELEVADVFAPQTMEDIQQATPYLAHDEVVAPALSGGDGSSTAFRMAPETSPIRKDVTQVAMATESKKKRKNKKRTNQKGFQGLFTPVYPINQPNAGSSTSPKPPAPTLPPFEAPRRSPIQKPTTPNGGISMLKMQLDALSLNNGNKGQILSSNASVLSETETSNASVLSDSDQTETYEVHLEHDFVSTDARVSGRGSSDNLIEDRRRNRLCRKMTADDFEPLTCLGKGTFGTVLLVRHRLTGALYAQKQFRKASLTVHKKLVEQTKTERAILESVNRYPFIVNLYYAFQDHEKLYLILEYAQGGELFTHLALERMFSEDVAAFYMAELVLALEHLHINIGVIYRDLKPENCLLDVDGHLLLTDFGLSKVAVNDDDRCNSSLGTFEYMAPEVIKGKPYGKACDWWSLGALGFDLLTGSPPFTGNNNAKIAEKIIKQKLALPYFLGPDAKDLLTRLLRKEPHKRLGYNLSKDIKTIKGHRFFRKIDWKALEKRELDPPIKPIVTDPALAENFSVNFTNLPLSPVVENKGGFRDRLASAEEDSMIGGSTQPMAVESSFTAQDNPFGGFSFVAPSSLLDGAFGEERGYMG